MSVAIEVQGLRKRYADTIAVHDVSFSVKQGEIFGIVGPNGAGKTTTVECIEGLRSPDAGHISVLGLNPARDRAELTERLGVQLQDSELPERLRVGEALRLYGSFYDSPADWRELMEQLGLSEKEKTSFGKLSGGQRQRLSIARAILKDAPILVLDEATSAVDTETERAIQQSLRKLTAGRTALIIAHRLSTIRHADRILVLRDGRVAEEGHHDDLLARGGTYADLWHIQSGELEPTEA
jgi:ABC-2 type transport system ATP-binding protein